MPYDTTRIRGAGGRGGADAARAFAQTGAPLLTRAIPSSGERLPAVGLGTAQVFNTATTRRPGRKPRRWCRR